MFDVNGHVAVVTGAATGIGKAIAQRLVKAGAIVAVVDLNLCGAREVAAVLGGSSFAVQCDISRRQSVEEAVEAVLKQAGQIDILVNNAGIAGRAAPLWEQSDEDWSRIIEINMNGLFYFCRAVVPHMRTRRYGRIVNIASIAGKEGNPNMAPYSATKAAVIAITKSLGKELATNGICVNAVSPAVIQTQILEQLSEAQVNYMTERIPMHRVGNPDEVAAVVHFLASPDCSFVTAQCYDASGGRATY
jgi:NAD(P)-dependent dehydrogenase (short-subunit alcohol dehydrogenase family)